VADQHSAAQGAVLPADGRRGHLFPAGSSAVRGGGEVEERVPDRHDEEPAVAQDDTSGE